MSSPYKSDLATWRIKEYISSLARGEGGDYCRQPSENAQATGLDHMRAFRGADLLEGREGSKLLFNADQTFVGLGSADEEGQGSLFLVRLLLAAIGSGQVYYDGTPIGDYSATSVLQFLKKSGSSFAVSSDTGPFQAGHAQPSAPTIYAKSNPSVSQTAMNSAVTVVCWRVSSITGQVSLKSLPSNVLTLSNQSCIVQLSSVDSNGQDIFGLGVVKPSLADLGNHYQLPISLGGEVEESVLAYTRTVTGASIADTTNVVDVTDADTADRFTSADIGRRISFDTFDSWITAINSPTQVQVNDTNSSGGTISGDATITHAVDGILRSLEISWTAGALIGQALAPDKAFPPPAGQFAGVMKDTLWLDADGIIYIGEPGFIGSFPPSNAQFASESAIHYLKASDDLTLRIGKHSFGALAYVGGSPSIEYQTIRDQTTGILFPQNIAVGANGRIMVWLGRPAIFESGIQPDIDFAQKVMPDFEGWENQTIDTPVVPKYDPIGEYEVWCYQQKINAFHYPSRRWSAPANLEGLTIGNVVGAIIAAIGEDTQRLYLCCSDGEQLALYQYDAGTGSVMLIQTSDFPSRSEFDTITEIKVQVRADNTDEDVTVEVIKNFDDDNPESILDGTQTPAKVGTTSLRPMSPDVMDAEHHAIRIRMTSQGGDCGVNKLETLGSTSGVVRRAA